MRVYKKEIYTRKRKIIKAISYLVFTIGSILMFWAFYPLVSFTIYANIFLNKKTASPVPETRQTSSINLAQSLNVGSNLFSNNLRDFTQANVWFSVVNDPVSSSIEIKEYYLSIPKLNLKDLRVVAGGKDLSKSLIHYIPTSRPGQYGNVAIFGHSTLPQLYNPSDYKTVFTYLPQIDLGDKIIITIEGKNYVYEVFDIFIVNPDKISVLEQKFNASYLTLVTCVPPGTYAKRLIVKGKLNSQTP